MVGIADSKVTDADCGPEIMPAVRNDKVTIRIHEIPFMHCHFPSIAVGLMAMHDHLFRKIIILVIGLWIMSVGIAFSIAAGLGTSPISSLPYTLSMFTPLTVGTATILLHVVLITLQILILRRRYKPLQLLQLPLAVIFGFLTDASVAMLGALSPANYAESWLFCLIGIVLVAAGVSAEVLSGTIPLAAEGLSLALADATGRRFGTMKVAVDCSLVILSLILSYAFLRSFGGVREGTAAAALLVGTVARFFSRILFLAKTRHSA